MTSTRSSASRARSPVSSVDASSTTKIRSTNSGMPRIVVATSVSSWYAGITTATVFPPNMSSGGACARSRPEQRHQRREDEAEERTDDRRSPRVAGVDLRGDGGRHDPRPLDLLDGLEKLFGRDDVVVQV